MSGTDTLIAEERQLAELFTALAAGDLEGFLSGCSEDLLLTVRGTAAASTYVRRPAIGAWYGGLRALTEDSLRAEVVLTLSMGLENVVILRHSFVRHGEVRTFDTVNHCVFHDGRLVAWFSRPATPQEYTDAWSDRGRADAGGGYAARSSRYTLSGRSR